eukprot:SAG31_NODE_37_length_31616_cov_38.688359_5_plen_105_part_00
MRENRKIVPGLAGTKKVSHRRDTKEPIRSRGVEDAPSYLRHHFSFLAHLVGVQRGCVFWRWRLVPTRVGVSPGRAPARIEGFWVASGTRVASTSVVVTASSELG